MDILRRDIPQIDLVNPSTVFHIEGHAGRRSDVINFHGRIVRKDLSIPGLAGEGPPGSPEAAGCIDFFHFLHDFKEACPARDPVGLEGGRHGETYGLVGPGDVSHYQVGLQRIQATLAALHGGVEGLKIDGQICAVLFHECLLSPEQDYSVQMDRDFISSHVSISKIHALGDHEWQYLPAGVRKKWESGTVPFPSFL